MFLIVLLLSLAGKNEELKETLRSALDFYRENRELLQALAKENSTSPEKTRSEEETKSSPEDGGAENLKILEEFLKKRGG